MQRAGGGLCSGTGTLKPLTRTNSGGACERPRTESLLDGGEVSPPSSVFFCLYLHMSRFVSTYLPL